MTNYAVLIGNSEFPREPGLRPLTCPAYDVEGLAAVLTAEGRGQFTAEHISVLKNKPHYEAHDYPQILKTSDDMSFSINL